MKLAPVLPSGGGATSGPSLTNVPIGAQNMTEADDRYGSVPPQAPTGQTPPQATSTGDTTDGEPAPPGGPYDHRRCRQHGQQRPDQQRRCRAGRRPGGRGRVRRDPRHRGRVCIDCGAGGGPGSRAPGCSCRAGGSCSGWWDGGVRRGGGGCGRGGCGGVRDRGRRVRGGADDGGGACGEGRRVRVRTPPRPSAPTRPLRSRITTSDGGNRDA